MALSAFFFALMAAAAKVLGPRVGPQEVILFRSVLNVAFTLAWLRRRNHSWWPRQPWLLFLRGAAGYTALSAYFWSVAHQPLATAVLVQQVHPVFTALLAAWALAERPGPWFLPAFLLALLGVSLLVPGASAGGAGGGLPLAVGLCAAVLTAVAYVTVRHASRTENEETIILWFALTSVPFAAAGTLMEGPVLPGATDALWLLVVAVAGQLGQVFVTRGLARVPAGRATLANPLTIAFGAGFGWLLFGEVMTLTTLAGAAAIVAAVLLASRKGAARGGA